MAVDECQLASGVQETQRRRVVVKESGHLSSGEWQGLLEGE